MKVAGSKIFGQDAALTVLDFDKKTIFAVSGDRVSRIKKDNYDLSQLLKDPKTPALNDVQILAYPFEIFGGRDALLETKGTSYFWLKLEKFRRNLHKPKYRSDLATYNNSTLSFKTIFHYVKSPKNILLLIRRKFLWYQYKNDKLSKNFHEYYVNKIIKDFCVSSQMDPSVKIEKHDHETSHAYAAFYLSSFIDVPKVCVLTLDEHGDESFSKVFMVQRRTFKQIGSSKAIRRKINGQFAVTSIGGLYSNFTEALGFIRSSDEGKVEALAAFGNTVDSVFDDLKQTIIIKDYTFHVNEKKYWKYCDLKYLARLREEFGDKDLARTIQEFLEFIVVCLLKKVKQDFNIDHLCIAGGVAANVIMNLKIYEDCAIKNLFICPPMGDDGSALGAAIKSAVENKLNCDWISSATMPYFGPEFSTDETKNELIKRKNDVSFKFIGDTWPEIAGIDVSKNKIIGVFNGKMEFGPRSLGNRSIIANPLDPNARTRINNEIKKRHEFQPFCPSVLEDDRKYLFADSFPHKHMAIAFRMKKEFLDILSSAIHVDGTARPQFVEENDNPAFYNLIKAVKKETGFGIVINTSFNLHGRPVVYQIEHAIDDFLDCGLDKLFINGFEVTKK